MQAITKYRANDGTEFDTEEKCVAHEALCAEIAGIMAALPPRPKSNGCEFENGHGYIQHNPATFYGVWGALLQIAKRIDGHRWFDDAIARPLEVHPSYPGRIISETSTPLYHAWHRMLCTDKALREWGQPYFANNPNDPDNCVRINP